MALIKNFKLTKIKILITLFAAAAYYILFNISVFGSELLFPPAITLTGGFTCLVHKDLPLIAANSNIISEWQLAGTTRCGPESRLQQIFADAKSWLDILRIFVVPAYVVVCVIEYFLTRISPAAPPDPL